MPDQPTLSPRLEIVKGQDIGAAIGRAKRVELAKTQPQQLALFQRFLGDPSESSNTIELYDAIPKYFTTKQQMALRRIEEKDGKRRFLPALKHTFRYTNRHTKEEATYTVRMTPARLEDNDLGEKEYYPSSREELIEEALKKMACEQRGGVFLNDRAGVQFTLYELKQELRSRGHDIDLNDLIQSLTINRRAVLSVTKTSQAGDEVILDSAIFPTLIIANRREWRRAPKETRCYVEFNPLITLAINAGAYRQFNYIKYMAYRHQLSRWLHKRLYHTFTNADLLHPYKLLQSTIERDSKLVNARRTYDRKRAVVQALDELVAKDIIYSYAVEERRGHRHRLSEILYTLPPTVELVGEIKRANRRAADHVGVLQRHAERA